MQSKKAKVILRADGDVNIGMGHFIRSIALAEMLQDKFLCIFATCDPTDYQISEMKRTCDDYIILPKGDLHYLHFLNYLTGDEIVVLDNYFFTTDYQILIQNKGCKLVCIDDIHDKHYVADIVINHAPISQDGFSLALNTKLLLGLNYALLRPPFLKTTFSKKMINKFDHIFINFGGADPLNLSCKILKQLLDLENNRFVTIVVGDAYEYLEELNGVISDTKSSQVEVRRNVTADNMVDILNQVDLAIVPCSTVLYEVLSQKTPVITGWFVDNQVEIALGLKDKYQQVKVVGDLRELFITDQFLEDFGRDIRNLDYPEIVNFQSKELLIEEFEKLSLLK